MSQKQSQDGNDHFQLDFEQPLQPQLQAMGWAKEVTDIDHLIDSDDVEWIDIREPEEWAMFRIKGASHIPMGELGDRLDELAQDKDIFILCLSGQRSAAVTVELRKRGFDHVYNVTGGLAAWVKQGLAVERG